MRLEESKNVPINYSQIAKAMQLNAINCDVIKVVNVVDRE